MGFDLIAYDTLKSGIIDSCRALILKYKSNQAINNDKIPELLSLYVPEERKKQALVLLKTIAILDTYDKTTEQKQTELALILNALALRTIKQIEESYKVKTIESDLHASLTVALNLNKENFPDRNQKATLYDTLKEFLKNNVYVDGDARKGYLAVQPFDIIGYSAKNEIDVLENITYQLWKEIRKEAEVLEMQSRGCHRSSFFSNYFPTFSGLTGSNTEVYTPPSECGSN